MATANRTGTAPATPTQRQAGGAAAQLAREIHTRDTAALPSARGQASPELAHGLASGLLALQQRIEHTVAALEAAKAQAEQTGEEGLIATLELLHEYSLGTSDRTGEASALALVALERGNLVASQMEAAHA